VYDKGGNATSTVVQDGVAAGVWELDADAGVVTIVPFGRLRWKDVEAQGVTVQEVMTDNGRAYLSHAHAAACRALRIRHLRTRPYRPRTQGGTFHPHPAGRLGLCRDLS